MKEWMLTWPKFYTTCRESIWSASENPGGGGMKTGTRSWRRGASHDPSPQSEAPTEILFKEKENQPPMNTDKDMIKNES